MKIRIAILAACASTLALAQADVARANYGAASESKIAVSVGESGAEPALVFAQGISVPVCADTVSEADERCGGKKSGAKKKNKAALAEKSLIGQAVRGDHGYKLLRREPGVAPAPKIAGPRGSQRQLIQQ
jgi:hypothetical protein